MSVYLGIDVGTTNLKVAAFDAHGQLCAYHSEPTPRRELGPGSAEMDPLLIWERVLTGLRCVCAAVGKDVRSIGVSSMGEAGILCDRDGKPLSDFMVWYDSRPQPIVEAFLKTHDAQEVFMQTGQIPAVKYGLMKLLWLRREKPALFRQARHWLSVEDWILFCLTGEYATDESIASRTMAFDVRTRSWSSRILSSVDMEPELFSPVFPGGTPVGTVRGGLAQELGLPAGTVVSTGGHDHACAAVSINIVSPGVMLDSMGTAEVLMTAADAPLLEKKLFDGQYCVYPHCGPLPYRIVSSNQSCGACIEWYLNTFGSHFRRSAAQPADAYRAMTELAASAADTESGVLFLPFIRGAVENPFLKGSFLGMDDSNTEAEYVRAIIDGLGYEIRHQMTGLEALTGTPVQTVRVVGGPSKSPLIMQRKAVTQNCRIDVPQCTEAACKGAAILAAIAAGDLSFSQIAELAPPGTRYDPQPGDPAQQTYRRYLSAREVLNTWYRQKGAEQHV